MKIDKSKLKVYAASILIAEGVGGASALISNMAMDAFRAAEKPALTPPDIVFPIVWTILFALMGISSARIWLSPPSRLHTQSLAVYFLQLVFNFLWTILFFNFQAYGLAFLWILLLWALILMMILRFYAIDKTAGLLQIPYLLWVAFATYLNYMIWMLNK